MEIAVSRNGRPIRISDERWTHVVEAHDYMAGNMELVIETIEDPDAVVVGSKRELIALRCYETTVLSEKYVVAVYREFSDDGFLITAFMTSRPDTILRKGILWQKPQTY
jgi:Barnase-EndoU-ColicinE5/D-RelE like nuclease